MIFLVFILLIALIVISLNIKDNSNLQKIESYLLKQNCKNIVYAKGSFKAICDKKIIEIKNSFSVDLEKNKIVLDFNRINQIKQKDNSLILNTNYKLKFKTIKQRDIFYKNLIKNLAQHSKN